MARCLESFSVSIEGRYNFAGWVGSSYLGCLGTADVCNLRDLGSVVFSVLFSLSYSVRS